MYKCFFFSGTGRSFHSCTFIRHPYSNYPSVLIAGGKDSSDMRLDSVEVWNVMVGTIVTSSFILPEPVSGGRMLPITDSKILLIGGSTGSGFSGKVYDFNFQDGFTERTGGLLLARELFAAFEVPKHEFFCQNPYRKLHVINRPWQF